jgi:hypothetical protein
MRTGFLYSAPQKRARKNLQKTYKNLHVLLKCNTWLVISCAGAPNQRRIKAVAALVQARLTLLAPKPTAKQTIKTCYTQVVQF